MGPDFARKSLLTSVLKRGEQLLWAGEPRRPWLSLPALRYVVMIAIAAGYLFKELVVHYRTASEPLSIFLQMELITVGIALWSPAFLVLMTRRQDRNITYAITNQRLLMALGPNRDQIREVALTDLASVQVHYRRRYGYNALNFTKRGQSAQMPVWVFADSGRPDRWDSPWIPEDPQFVRRMIEDARAKLYPLSAHGTSQNCV
jgi:hypothetical protein